MSDSVFDIENDYDLAKVKVNGHFIWEVLRMPFFFNLLKNKESGNNKKPSLMRSLSYVFYGWVNWFKKYDVICISNSGGGYRRELDGVYYNRFLDPVMDLIGSDRTLLIEKPDPKHFPIKTIETKNIVSDRIIVLMKNILSKIINVEIENRKILDEIKKENILDIDYMYHIKQFMAQKTIYTILFELFKPKAIFLTCYYGKEGIIIAAKNMNIPVIEIQHGIIGHKHPAYNHKIYSRDYYSDYLLTFGEAEVKTPGELFIFEKSQVYAVGSHYINYMSNKKTRNPIEDLIKKYDYSIAITMQYTIEKELLDFIIKASSLNEKILYFLLPRKTSLEFTDLPENVKVVTDINFYEMMAFVDFHSTVYSTCAIEAPSLGVQNILIDINGLAKEYYEEILSNERVTKFVERPEELIQVILDMPKMNKIEIKESNNQIFVQNYDERMTEFLRKLHLV